MSKLEKIKVNIINLVYINEYKQILFDQISAIIKKPKSINSFFYERFFSNYINSIRIRQIWHFRMISTRDANPIQSMAIIDYRLSYFLSIGLSIGLSNILSIGLSIGLSNILSIGLLSMSFHRFFSIISDLLVD